MKKVCPVCNNEFTTNTAQKTCSEKCHSEHKRIKMREFLAAHPGYMKKYYHEHYSPANRKQKKQQQEIAKSITTAIEKEKTETESNIIEPLQVSYMEVHGQKIKVTHCAKMRIKATKLPCGLRRECYVLKCEHLPKGATMPQKHWIYGNVISGGLIEDE